MKHKTESPSLIRDVGAIAGLYRDVFWMLGKRLQHGPDWHQRLSDDAMRLQELEEPREHHASASRHN